MAPPFGFLNNLGDAPSPFGRGVLRKDYGLFGHAVAIHFFCETKENVVSFFKHWPPLRKIPEMPLPMVIMLGNIRNRHYTTSGSVLSLLS